MRRRGRPRHPDILTPREWEVLSLIEQGASNEEIAQRLGVTERTAKYHVSEILSKLDVSSREEAVAVVGERRVRTRVLGQWALALKVAATTAAVAALAGVGVLAWMVVRGDDEEGIPAAMSLDEVFSRTLAGATRGDEILHTSMDYRIQRGDGEAQVIFGEMWIDSVADTARLQTHAGEGWSDSESDGEDLIIATGEFDYHENSGGDAYRIVAEPTCPGTSSAILRILLACGGNPRIQPNESPVITETEWEGRRAVAVTMFDGPVAETFETPAALETPGTPTVTPQATAGQVTSSPAPAPDFVLPSPRRYDFTQASYLDPGTFLPFASTYNYEYADDGMSVTAIIRYEHEFINRSSVPEDFFDPVSIGWRG